jgi:hypothetical protein
MDTEDFDEPSVKIPQTIKPMIMKKEENGRAFQPYIFIPNKDDPLSSARQNFGDDSSENHVDSEDMVFEHPTSFFGPKSLMTPKIN